jgi:hypothetical protein
MGEEKRMNDSGFIPKVTPQEYFSAYNARFGEKGFGQKFLTGKYKGIHPDDFGHEMAELGRDQMVVTDYPEPSKRYLLEYYQATDAVEPMYYLCTQIARDLGYGDFVKVTDVFAASEQSSLYGAAQQRLGLAQDRVSQYLRVINDMVKGMFQIIRELRILDERLSYYEAARSKGERGEHAEVSLKGLWIDLVEGGSKNPGSVLGLSQQLGFTILPDLFFRTCRKPLDEIKDDEVDAKEKRTKDLKDKNEELSQRIEAVPYNDKIKEVLGRKLTQFYIWKDSTETELTVRRGFMIKYFRQYYTTIKLYMAWIRPYLKQIRRLQLDVDKTNDKDLISAFEGSMIEIEVIAKRKVDNKNPFYCVLMCTFEHTTQPKLSFALEGGFHRGPVHTGRTFITWRGYSWTDEDIQNYFNYRDSQDFELLASVSSTLRAALESVEGDIRKYLEDLGEEFVKKDVSPEKKKETLDLLEPFIAVVKGFWEPLEESRGGMKDWFKDVFGKKEVVETDDKGLWKAAFKESYKFCFTHYKLVKNANGFLTW